MAETGLRLDSVTKVFLGRTVLQDISLDAAPGEIVAVTGPSGAGKSTICRLITGLEAPESGSITMDGVPLSTKPTQDRNVAHMFESYALYPHLKVAQNVAFPLTSPARKNRYSRDEVESRVLEFLRMAEIEHLRDRLPGALSGGQKQRVALCRALVQDAAIYLLDEPISHLDAKLRNALRGLIRRQQSRRPAPTIWATPDAMEALSVADRVAVLIDGRIEQFAAPEEIYYHPATTAVARLVGDPAMNLFVGELARIDGTLRFEGPGFSLSLPPAFERPLGGESSRRLTLGIRPNAMEIAPPEAARDDVSMTVYAWEPFGKYSLVTARITDGLIRIKTANPAPFHANDTIRVRFDASKYVLFDSVGARIGSV